MKEKQQLKEIEFRALPDKAVCSVTKGGKGKDGRKDGSSVVLIETGGYYEMKPNQIIYIEDEK